MTFEHLQVHRGHEGRVVYLRFEHGKANEVGTEVLRELERLAELLETDPEVVALVTWSERSSRRGTPIFVAGANVTERVGWDDDAVKRHVRWQRSVLQRLSRAPVFHVAVINGVALGWGTEYLLTTDYAIATFEAKFGLPETGLGILPGAGGTTELQLRIGPSHALRLGMTGERIASEEAVRIGLVQERVEDVQAGLRRAEALVGLTVRNSPTAMAAFKAGLQRSVGQSGELRTEIEAEAYERCVDHGEAAIGRAHFASRSEERANWGSKTTATQN